MKQFLIWCFGLCLVVLSARTAEAYKAGYVDLRKALNSVSEGITAKKYLKRRKRQYQMRLGRLQRDLQREQQIFKEQVAQGLLKGERRLRAQQRLQYKLARLQHIYKTYTKKLKQEEARLTKQIFDKMAGIIQAISLENKLDFMFEKTESSVLFAKAKHNYTKELIRRYEKKYGKVKPKLSPLPKFMFDPKDKSGLQPKKRTPPSARKKDKKDSGMNPFKKKFSNGE